MLLLANLLKGFVQRGRLDLFDARGNRHRFGSDDDVAPVTLRLHDRALHWKLFLNPELAAAEAYMDGTLTFEEGSAIYDLLYLFSINRPSLGAHPVQSLQRRLWRAARRRHQANDVERAKKQARHHYDLATDLYRLFLDEDLNYSCAFFRSPDDSLETAQRAKLARATAKLALEPGMSVCEIGGGWGAFAIELAKAGADVTSINVSPEQIKHRRTAGERRWRRRPGPVRFKRLSRSRRHLRSRGLDRHDGTCRHRPYRRLFRQDSRPSGARRLRLHSFDRTHDPARARPGRLSANTSFPGGYVPALSEVFAAAERQGIWVADMEVLRLHYYYTIRHWRAALRHPPRRGGGAL